MAKRFTMAALAGLNLDAAKGTAPEWFRRGAAQSEVEQRVDEQLFPSGRGDASESVFIERQLLIVRAGLLSIKWPALNADDWVPAEPQALDPGANHFTWQWLQHYGQVKLHTGMSERGPLAEVKKEEATPLAFVSKTNAYDYTLQDIRSANFANFDLPGNKAKAARLAHEQHRDEVMLVGDGTATYDGRYGLFKLPNVLTYALPVGASLSASWLFKTPDEIVADMNAVCDKPITNSNGVEMPDTLGVPLAAMNIIAEKRMGDGSNVTILKHFLENRRERTPGFQVRVSWRLDTAGTNGRLIAYERNAEKVARLDSVRFEQNQPQLEGFRTVTDCHSRNAGVWTGYPKSICTADGCIAAS